MQKLPNTDTQRTGIKGKTNKPSSVQQNSSNQATNTYDGIIKYKQWLRLENTVKMPQI